MERTKVGGRIKKERIEFIARRFYFFLYNFLFNLKIINYKIFILGTDVAKNLKAFSGYRSDIFGTEETEIGRKV
jgi:hypothetical protein